MPSDLIIGGAILFGIATGWLAGRPHSSVKLIHRSVRFQDQIKEVLSLEENS